ncbi:hypothetical protein O6H91_15G049300 [Diphasiastrum complanatum]|uniref:Uncharacterized protein n=1 Tax=Diphasiastrum complanatum TaxID=34168 RepID=A0ACC2BI30_DIPCM|nr:hypothetical protein O6H91_15G049300 [Diphasiastrum complanatum]
MADRVYPASKQQPRLNGAYYNQKQRIPPPATYRAAGRRCPNPFCCCLGVIFSLLVTIIIILAIAGAIIYFVLHPKAPKYNLLDAHFSQLSVTNNPSQLSYDITFTLQAYNPNKKIGIYYDDVLIFMFYEDAQVGQSSIAPFYQGHRNTTILKNNLKGNRVGLQQPMATSLTAAIGQHNIPLQILVKMKVRVKIGKWKSPHFKVKDNCGVAVSPPSAPGGAHLLSHSCKVKWGI